MTFFKRLKERASKDPKTVVLPEYHIDTEGVISEAIDIAGNTAIPVKLTLEMMRDKIDEFADYYAANIRDANVAVAKKLLIKQPVAFAAMMLKLGYAHAMVAGRYKKSCDIMRFVKPIIDEEEGKIGSAIFYKEPPPGYPVFDFIACADMVVNADPDAEQLYRIIITSADSFETLTGKQPSIALLSYVTGGAQSVQTDPELKKIKKALELYKNNNHKWPIWQSQADAALKPDIAKKKSAPFKRPVDLLIGSNLGVSNTSYKLLEALVPGGGSMFVTQGLRFPAMDLSRGDSAENIANVLAACSVKAQMLESQGGYTAIDKYFIS